MRSHNPPPFKGLASSLTLVALSNRRGMSQSSSFEAQRLTPLQGLVSSLTLVALSNRCGMLQSTLLRGPTSSVTHRLLPSSDIICNSLTPLLVDIVYFGPLHIVVSLTRGFHTLIKKVSFSSPTDVGSNIDILDQVSNNVPRFGKFEYYCFV